MCKKIIYLPYLALYISCFAIYRLFNVKQLKQDIKSRWTHTYKMHENRCVLLKSDMHVHATNAIHRFVHSNWQLWWNAIDVF